MLGPLLQIVETIAQGFTFGLGIALAFRIVKLK
jgi:hypothetical protein